MSGTYPATPGFKASRLRDNQEIVELISESGKRQAAIIGGQHWGVRCTYSALDRSQIAPLYAFAAKQRSDAFQIVIAPHDTPLGAVSGTIKATGTDINVAGSNIIRIDGFVSGLANAFKAGDVIKTSSHTKVYMVVEDASAGSGDLELLQGGDLELLQGGNIELLIDGQADLTIIPPLIQNIADDETITYNNVPFTMTFRTGIQKFKTRASNEHNYAVDLIEAIN